MTKLDISCTCVYCNIYSVNFTPGCFYLKNQYCCTKLFITFFSCTYSFNIFEDFPKKKNYWSQQNYIFYKVEQKNWPKLNCVSAITHTLVMQCVIKKSLLIYGICMYFCLFNSCHEMITFMFDVFKLNAAICSKKRRLDIFNWQDF